jgi:superoxide dismutase, Fe-Mn family
MDARILPLPFDAQGLRGLSEKLILSHHQNDYAGAVRLLNAIRAQLAGLAFGNAAAFRLNGLKREELIATNSMLLHELYLAGLGGDGATMEPAMKLALDANFGSVERWREEFVRCAKALGGGSGWMLLVFRPREGTLVNHRAPDDTHAVAGGVSILALDMHAHAHHPNHGAAAAACADAFMTDIDWAGVYRRRLLAVDPANEPFAVDAEGLSAVAVLDVRRAGVFAQAPSMIPRARWCDPATVVERAKQLPGDRPVVVHCVYGHEVGRSTAMRLRATGLDGRHLGGGIDGWASAGRTAGGRQGARVSP